MIGSLVAVQPAAAGRPAVSSGALRASVGEDPWSLALTDRRGRTVLAQHGGRGPGPTGTLGFRTAAGWSHATRVLTSKRGAAGYRAVLATQDPDRTIALTLRPAGSGVIALEAKLRGPAAGVEAVGIGFDARDGERYLGFGERSNRVDQSGGVIENYVADGPYQDREYPFLAAFVPIWALRDGRPDATYFPIPWLLSTAGYGVLVDNPETSRFRLRSDDADAWSVEVVRAPEGEPGAEPAPAPDKLRLRFFAGPRPAAALRRFTHETGRQPPATRWVYGPWFQPGDDAADLELLRKADAPVSVIQTYTHYLPCGDQETRAERARTAAAHDAGVAITTYFNPMVCTDYAAGYEPARAAGALTETRVAGVPWVYRYGAQVEDAFFVSQYDFFERAGRKLYGARLKEAIDDGYDGWMEDFGEYTPLDSVSAGEIPGTRAHNPYPREYHCAAYAAVRDQPRPIARFQRSGWAGVAPCTHVAWGGDPTTAWGFDGLRSAVTQALSIGSSGIAIWGSDVGGFFALVENELTPELLTRWVQLGAVSPVMRTQRNGVAVPPRARPQVTDRDQIANWRRYTKLHTQLYPYVRAAERTYRRTGLPIMRHLALVHPADRTAASREDQFMFGPDLLAAPVLEPGARQRRVYLPRGRWIDLWRSARFDARGSGRLVLGRARRLRGRREVTLPAPLRELPLLVRAGAVLPLLPASVDTLAWYAGRDRRDGVTSVAERRNRLQLLAFPAGSSNARFGSRGRIRSRVLRRRWQLRIRAPRRQRIALQAAMSAMRRPFRPCRLKLNRRRLRRGRWRYDPGTQVLTVRFKAKRATLTVLRCTSR
jgi:sulfoquinovosidase